MFTGFMAALVIPVHFILGEARVTELTRPGPV